MYCELRGEMIKFEKNVFARLKHEDFICLFGSKFRCNVATFNSFGNLAVNSSTHRKKSVSNIQIDRLTII